MAQRTSKQNNSVHLFCKQLADELNGKGQYMQIVLKPTYELRWDTKTVKEHLWRPIQKVITQKQSTTELDTNEVTKVHEQLMLALTEKLPIDYVDFPNEEQTENYLNSFK